TVLEAQATPGLLT
nr:immunoglobulin heavy chain junction region [Mus musculus]MBK4188247.1 immunoglobulin heavy chain junction region [Mus musculus]